ncbi:MAG: AzlD domain-containing protein [Actinobacteria bacterium]|nr:AzlD domain-containing protein [Actinomycetota bacterium]MCB9390140.1 AzlD domain-containing protein [Acidimicrobiia bacterium]
MSPFWMIVLVGVGTYAFRVSMIVALGRFELSERVRDNLRLIAPAVLSALVARGMLLEGTELRPLSEWHVAGVVAVIVAWRTKSVLWTLFVGMVTLWIVGAII